MRLKNKKTVLLWDVDGTLLLTGGAGRESFNQIFKDLYGVENVFDTVDPHGRTDVSLIKECYHKGLNREPTDTEIENVKNIYIRTMPQCLKTSLNFRLMPHVKETLESLSQNPDVIMGLATGNFKATAYQKLKHAQLDHYFDFGGFGCDGEDRKELTQRAVERALERVSKISLNQIFLIGDTVHDVACGLYCGVNTVAVCTANTSRAELERAGAHFVIDDLTSFDIHNLV